MAIQARLMSVEAYMAFDEASEIQHEFIDGEIIPMPGGSGPHNVLVANAIIALGNLLWERDCTLFGSQMRVQIDHARYLYPDLSVVRGAPAYLDDNEVILLNPTVVVEVISPSSIDRDRVTKVDLYSAVPSVQGYLILDQERVFAEWRARTESGWQLRQFSRLDDEIPLEPLGCRLSLAQVYRGVNLAG